MADLRIADAPEIDESEVQGGLKIPTGGFGNKAINMTTVANWVVKDKDLPSKDYVDTAVAQGNQGLAGHIANKNNPHEVTKEQVGLGNVDNTADADKPISNATSVALNLKADKTQLDGKADKSTTYTKTEVDGVVDDLYQSLEDNFVVNGAALPYDPQVTYNDGAIVVDNGVLKKVEGGTLVNAVDAESVSVGASTLDVFTQNQVNKTYSLTDAGGIGGGANDTVAFQSAIETHEKLTLDTDTSLIKQPFIERTIDIGGSATLIQDTAQQHILIVGHKRDSAQANNLVKDVTLQNFKFGEMPESTTDDFSAVHVAGGDSFRSVLNSFDESETGTTFCVYDAKFADPTFQSIDSLALGNSYRKTNRFAVQNLQASFSRIIGITAHNYGDNTSKEGQGVNAGGFNVGVRLAGICRGNIVSASNLRDKRSAIDFQLGCKFNVINGTYIENSYSNAINQSSTGFAYSGNQNIQGVTIVNSGDSAVRLRYSSHNRLNALIDTTGKTANSAGYGIDASAMTTADDEHFIIEFTGGSGVVPDVDAEISQGNIKGLFVRVVSDGLKLPQQGENFPTAGTIIVKNVTGGVFKAGALTGVTATAVRSYAAEGRHRIDATVSNAKSQSLRLSTNGNLVDLISTNCPVADVGITSDYNNVRVIVTENDSSNYSIISGDNNVVHITDNTQSTNKITLLVSGNNNTIVVNTKGRISVSGNDNTIIVNANLVNVSGLRNNISGTSNINDTSTGGTNNYRNHNRGSAKGIKTATSDANGVVTFNHGLAASPKTLFINLVDSDELLHARIVNLAATTSQCTFKLYKIDGTVAANKGVSFYYSATI